MTNQERELHDQLLDILFQMMRDEGEFASAEELEEIILRWVEEQKVRISHNDEVDVDKATIKTLQEELASKTAKWMEQSYDPGLHALAMGLEKVNQATAASKPLSMQKLVSHEKLPQDRIERNLSVEKTFGIKEMKCVVRRGPHTDGDWVTEKLEIRGELSGRLPKDIILFVKVYNGSGEMMAYEEIPIYHGEVSESFSKSIEIPVDETISRIMIRPIYRPTEMETSGMWASFFAHD